jgi:hypothetical protein
MACSLTRKDRELTRNRGKLLGEHGSNYWPYNWTLKFEIVLYIWEGTPWRRLSSCILGPSLGLLPWARL